MAFCKPKNITKKKRSQFILINSLSVIYTNLSIEQILGCMIEHTLLWDKLLGKKKSFDFLKKHYRKYPFLKKYLVYV